MNEVERALRDARIVWVLGPPGAGKTTWTHGAAARHPDLHPFDLAAWASQLQLPSGRRPGMRRAKTHLMEALRALAHAEGAPRRFVVSLVDVEESALFPVRPGEAVLALLPPLEQVRLRLEARPPRSCRSADWNQVLDEERRVRAWCATWGLPTIEDVHRPELLGLPMEDA